MVNKPKSGHGFPPLDPPDPRLSIDDWARVKAMFEDSSLAKYIIWAGWFALLTFCLEALRIVWLAVRYLKGF